MASSVAVLTWLALFTAQADTTETATTTQTSSVTAEFIKGEFAHAGVIRLVPNRSFIGARVGALIQEEIIYLTVAPKADLRFLDGRLRLGLEVPLNLEIYSLRSAADAGSGGGGFDQAGRLRPGDYDEARDFVKFLRYLTYGKKEDNLFVNVGQLYAATLGHGQIMRRYAGNIDINQTRVGVEVDAYNDYGGFEMFLADVTRGNVFGALAFIKPLSFFFDDAMARSLSLGVSWATDQKAPFTLQRGPRVGAAPVGPVLTEDDGGGLTPPLAHTRALNILGVDAELKVLKTQSVDLKTYADFSMLHGSGSGVAVGVLGRFNFRVGKTVHLLRTRLELRSYEANFLPSYFDTLYEFQKYQFIPDPDATNPNYRPSSPSCATEPARAVSASTRKPRTRFRTGSCWPRSSRPSPRVRTSTSCSTPRSRGGGSNSSSPITSGTCPGPSPSRTMICSTRAGV